MMSPNVIRAATGWILAVVLGAVLAAGIAGQARAGGEGRGDWSTPGGTATPPRDIGSGFVPPRHTIDVPYDPPPVSPNIPGY